MNLFSSDSEEQSLLSKKESSAVRDEACVANLGFTCGTIFKETVNFLCSVESGFCGRTRIDF